MASPQMKTEPKLAMEIRTKSVEQTLIPLVNQITTLVNAKERPAKSEKTLKALVRVGQAVSLAVERFVTVGEAIGEENADIKDDMCQACAEARLAGSNIQKLTDVRMDEQNTPRTLAEKTSMVRAARQLLSAVTKVLIMADKVVVKQVIASKDKVRSSLERIEKCSTFTDFVKSFSQFGNEMVELAHMSGDRQNDLKSDRARAQIGAARAILEKSTMMLLTTSKAFLRHPDCRSARQSREHVYSHMRKALDVIHQVITDGAAIGGEISPSAAANGDSGISLAQPQPTAFRAIKDFEDITDMTRVTLFSATVESKMASAVETVVETTQDFTDSAYTTHENRERILGLCEKVRSEAQRLSKVGGSIESIEVQAAAQELENAILKTREASKHLRKQLVDSAMDQASEVFKTNEDHELLSALKQAGLQGNASRVSELALKFQEHTEQIQEVCKLLRHISGTDPLVIWSDHAENITKTFAPQVVNAANTLSAYPTSKIAKENLEVFADAWASHINDLSVLVKDVNDVCQGKPDRTVYLSLPRPGCDAEDLLNRPYLPSPSTGSDPITIAYDIDTSSPSTVSYGNTGSLSSNAYDREELSDTTVAYDRGGTVINAVAYSREEATQNEVSYSSLEYTQKTVAYEKDDVEHNTVAYGSKDTSGVAHSSDCDVTHSTAAYDNMNQTNNNSCSRQDSQIGDVKELTQKQKHGTTAKGLRASRLNAEEQAKIAKLGLEMKLITSEMDAETEKWEEVDNELVRRAKNMSSMAFSMYLFTRGEGPLKNTQDLFTQAQYFAEEGVKLFQCAQDFSAQLPQSAQKVEVASFLERLPPFCQRLIVTLKAPTMGKTATFTKVDNVIQETKNLMNSVSKVVTASLIAATKFGIDYSTTSHAHRGQWRPLPYDMPHAAPAATLPTSSSQPPGGPHSDAGTGSDREGSVKSAKIARGASGSGAAAAASRRPDPVRRSASLNSRGTSYDRI